MDEHRGYSEHTRLEGAVFPYGQHDTLICIKPLSNSLLVASLAHNLFGHLVLELTASAERTIISHEVLSTT